MVWYYRLLKNFPQFIVIHAVKGFGIVSKAEIDAFLELSCFFDDPADVGNMISGSSAFSKTSLNIWKFMVHILLKPCLENFEHYFTTGGISHSFFQGIFLTQGSNLDLLHCRHSLPSEPPGKPCSTVCKRPKLKAPGMGM